MESRENKILDRLGVAAAVLHEWTVNLEHIPTGWVSFGRKWKIGTGKRYFADFIGLSSTTVTQLACKAIELGETQNKGNYAVQGHSPSCLDIQTLTWRILCTVSLDIPLQSSWKNCPSTENFLPNLKISRNFSRTLPLRIINSCKSARVAVVIWVNLVKRQTDTHRHVPPTM